MKVTQMKKEIEVCREKDCDVMQPFWKMEYGVSEKQTFPGIMSTKLKDKVISMR